MSPNIQETEAASRKRSHDEYAEGAVDVAVAASAVTPVKEPIVSSASVDAEADQPPNHTALSSPLSSPPMSSSPAANTDGGSNTSPHNSPSPKQTSAPSAMAPSKKGASGAQPSSSTTMTPSSASAPVKKKRTPAEIQAEQAEKQAIKAREEQERAAKRQKKEEEKAEKDRLKEEEKAEKEKARLAREAARKEKEAEKEALRKKKQEEEDKKKAEEEKKRRQQPTLSMMFAKKPKADAPSTPVKQSTIAKPAADPSPAAALSSPAVKQSKPDKLPYERFFEQMSSEAVTLKSKILDEYIYGQRGEENVKPFDPVLTFSLSGLSSSRGIIHPSVKKIMAELLGDPIESADRTESQQARFSDVQKQLSKVPVKMVSFYEDVRPAYVGTVTSFNPEELHKLARRPTRRVLTKLNYEYDSEAEWEEEEGEDLDDADDDEEGDDGDDEMADFLDDAEDAVAVRTAHLPEEEPKSTGICFENRQRAGPCPTVYKYRMEFLLDSLPHHHSIDPFATDYWEQPKPVKTEITTTSVAVRSSPFDKSAAGGMPPPPNPAAAAVDPKDMVPASEMANFKRAIVSDDISMLTKVSMIDMLSKRFKSCTKAQVRTTLEIVAHRVPKPGGKKSERYWSLLPGQDLGQDQ
ncbi:hypothetical protein PG984_013805 [Apiospora sp. TS-2023a]